MEDQNQIPRDQLQQDLTDQMMKIMHTIFDFMSKYEAAKKKHAGFKIDFIERNITNSPNN